MSDGLAIVSFLRPVLHIYCNVEIKKINYVYILTNKLCIDTPHIFTTAICEYFSASAVVKWAAETFSDSVFILYEQVSDKFYIQ